MTLLTTQKRSSSALLPVELDDHGLRLFQRLDPGLGRLDAGFQRLAEEPVV